MSLTDAFGTKKAEKTAEKQPRKTNGSNGAELDHVRKYVAKMEPAISGSAGHNATLDVVRVCKGFALDEAQTLDVLREFNERCQPPWSERELKHKANQLPLLRVVEGYILDQSRDWQAQRDEARQAMPAPKNGKARAADNVKDEARQQQARPGAIARYVDDIVNDWRNEGQLPRIQIGIDALDKMCGGGMPIPRKVLFTGAPGSAKTYLVAWIAHRFLTELAELGYLIGIVAADESDSDFLVRLCQMSDFTPEELEAREPGVLDAVANKFAGKPIQFYDNKHSIDDVIGDLAACGKALNRPCALFVDSVHTIWCKAGEDARSTKELIEENFKALAVAYDKYKMPVFTTGEMNRQGYASEKQAADANLLGSSAEARAAEYWAQIQIAMQTPKDCDGQVKLTVTKNRGIRTSKGPFWLQLLHDSHDIKEMGDPNENPAFIEKREEIKRAANNSKVNHDAIQLAKFMLRNPGLGTEELRAAVNVEPTMAWGNGRTHKALTAIKRGLTDYELRIEIEGKNHRHYVTLKQGQTDDTK